MIRWLLEKTGVLAVIREEARQEQLAENAKYMDKIQEINDILDGVKRPKKNR